MFVHLQIKTVRPRGFVSQCPEDSKRLTAFPQQQAVQFIDTRNIITTSNKTHLGKCPPIYDETQGTTVIFTFSIQELFIFTVVILKNLKLLKFSSRDQHTKGVN